MAKTIAGIMTIFLMLGSYCPVLAGDWTSHGFIYKPSLGARGNVEKNRYDSGLDRVDARLSKEIWVGDPNYGTTLQDALTAISGTQAILRVPAGTHSIGANLNVPSNVTLRVERMATLAIPAGVILTINGGLEAGPYQIFSCTGTGKVVFTRPHGARELYPQWWGAKADGATDDTAALQAMINCSVDSVGVPMFLPGGVYKISDTLKLNPGENFAGFTLRGAGSCASGAGFSTTIDATSFGDRPAINIQGARHVTLEDLYILGKNTAPYDNVAAANYPSDPAQWVSAGCSSGQHNPYAGIAIDAYFTTVPPDPYPNDPYGRSATSSYVTLRNITVSNFVVNYVISPAGGYAGDTISLYDCVSNYGTYAFSSGNSQNRSLQLYQFVATGHFAVVTTVRHGTMGGNAPSIHGGIFQLAYKCFEGCSEGLLKVIGLHTESVVNLGEFGHSSASFNYPTEFIGCVFGFFDNGGLSPASYWPAHIITAHNSIKFTGCTFDYYNQPAWNFYAEGTSPSNVRSILFEDCLFHYQLSGKPYIFLGGTDDYGSGSIKFSGCSFPGAGDGTNTLAIDSILQTDTLPARQPIGQMVYEVVTRSGGRTTYKIDRLNDYGYTSAIGMSNVSLSGSSKGATLAFDVGAGDVASFKLGDLLRWECYTYSLVYPYTDYMPCFRVDSINGTRITATAIFDGFVTSPLPGSIRIATPYHFNGVSSTGNTHSNTTVDNVTEITNWKVGDFIRGAGIPADTRIVNIAGTTITLSKAATATATGVTLYNCKLTAM